MGRLQYAIRNIPLLEISRRTAHRTPLSATLLSNLFSLPLLALPICVG